MDCAQCHRAINDFIDGELGQAAVAEFQEHLSFCADCGAELRDLSTLRLSLAQLGELELAVPEGFADEVMAAVAALPEPGLRDRVRELSERAGLPALPARRRAVAVSALAGIAAVAIGLEARHLRHHREATE
jgi:anti-sigma factor RsiW